MAPVAERDANTCGGRCPTCFVNAMISTIRRSSVFEDDTVFEYDIIIQMEKRIRIKKSVRKFIRLEKARIRRQFLDYKKQEELIKEMYNKLVEAK